MKVKFVILLIFGFFFHPNLLADSPLTSTQISDAYKDVEIVQFAAESFGSISEVLMDYLIDENNPIDLKIATINELGWSIRGKNNARLFYEYMKYKNVLQNIDNASAEILICYAYFMALDNYFDVEEAIIYANKAKAKNGKSYTIHMITALIEAQESMHSDDWCKVYNLVNNVRMNKTLTKDMREDAITIIFDYMGAYEEYCK